jgi:hypothetical protein
MKRIKREMRESFLHLHSLYHTPQAITQDAATQKQESSLDESLATCDEEAVQNMSIDSH